MSSATQNHIVSDAETCGGWPRVVGTRIRVWDIYVWSHRDRMSPAAIVAEFPQLTIAAVHAALAHYYDNVESIRCQVKEAARIVATAQGVDRATVFRK